MIPDLNTFVDISKFSKTNNSCWLDVCAQIFLTMTPDELKNLASKADENYYPTFENLLLL